ncbi:hypothetical protein [Actinomadura macra]|uniref:hypothetical protein n=1 Tax=Actinomadura macra TaxID=46164 RepID=UPI000AE46AE2|nr:hypothetical protein [Actinomadura macra]
MTTNTTDPHHSSLLVLLAWACGPVTGWACGTCGGGGVASDGSTCPDCHGHGHH